MKAALLGVLPEERWLSIEVYAERLARGLSDLDAGVQADVLPVRSWVWADLRVPTPYGRPASLRSLGLYLSRWMRYPLALRGLQADLYHVLDNSYGHLAFFLNPRQTLVTSHGGTPRSWRKWNPEGPAMWMFDLAFRGTLRAAHIITVSEYARRELLRESGYPAERVHVVHHGVDPAFRPLPASASQKLRSGLMRPNDRYLILHVGHSAARKNVESLYRALATLRQEVRGVRLLRIGRAPTPAQVRLINDLGIAPAITHLPPRPNQELPPYYGAADAFVFPSYYEGFGVPLLEAMACGTPVVASNAASLPEVVGDAGLLVDPHSPKLLAQAIARVLTEPELAAELRRQGTERAQSFTWERTAHRTLAIYRQLLSAL